MIRLLLLLILLHFAALLLLLLQIHHIAVAVVCGLKCKFGSFKKPSFIPDSRPRQSLSSV